MEKILSTNLLKKYRGEVLAIMAFFILAGLSFSYLIKPRFKVSSVVSISPSYFQNSLMREFLSEVYDPSELHSERLSIISEALDQKFLDGISVMTGTLPGNETSQQQALRRLTLSKAIEIIPLQNSDFQISVTDTDREKAMEVNQKVIENILGILKSKRTKTLTNLREAIAAQLDTMSPTIGQPTSPEALKMKIAGLESEVAQLESNFSNSHPVLQAKKKELQSLRDLLQAAKGKATDLSGLQLKMSDKGSTNTVYDDLTRKYRYLNIVLLAESDPVPSYFTIVRSPEYPLAAVWPKKGLFLLWATLLGIFTALIYIGVREYASYAVVAEGGVAQTTEPRAPLPPNPPRPEFIEDIGHSKKTGDYGHVEL